MSQRSEYNKWKSANPMKMIIHIRITTCSTISNKIYSYQATGVVWTEIYPASSFKTTAGRHGSLLGSPEHAAINWSDLPRWQISPTTTAANFVTWCKQIFGGVHTRAKIRTTVRLQTKPWNKRRHFTLKYGPLPRLRCHPCHPFTEDQELQGLHALGGLVPEPISMQQMAC